MIRKARIRSKITPSGESEVLVLLPGQNFGCTVKGIPWRIHQRGMWSYQMWSHIGSEWMQLRIYHEFPISSVIILSKNRGPKPALAVEFRGMFLMIKWNHCGDRVSLCSQNGIQSINEATNLINQSDILKTCKEKHFTNYSSMLQRSTRE